MYKINAHNMSVDTQYLFVDYKAAFDSPIRDRIFIFVMECVLLEVRVYRNDIIYQKVSKCLRMLDIIWCIKRDVSAEFGAIEPIMLGLAANEGKTKTNDIDIHIFVT